MAAARMTLVACALSAVVGIRAGSPAPAITQDDVRGAGPVAVETEPAPDAGPRTEPQLVTRLALPGKAPAPRTIRIPRIGVDAGVVSVKLDERGAISPPKWNVAGWYAGSVRPGEIGPAVVVGHVDSKLGPAVFYRLAALRPGDVVGVGRADGSQARFEVVSVKRYERTSMPESVYAMTSVPSLRLITCGGPYDPDSGYRDNVVVFAQAA